MSQGRPRPAQSKHNKSKHVVSMAERLSGGDLWEKETKPDEDFRLLAKNPGMTRDDYVDFPGRAAKEEPESCRKATLTQITDAANKNFAALKAREIRTREGQSLAGQIRELVSLANKQDADLPELAKIRDLLEDGRNRLRSAA